mmetsp:Transcript_2365/g.6626  ORF Transcript_2365/g.6626 Transcript_2365/m.6626 type:complete len:263 (-) Transcript_2365:438-1226(-)
MAAAVGWCAQAQWRLGLAAIIVVAIDGHVLVDSRHLTPSLGKALCTEPSGIWRADLVRKDAVHAITCCAPLREAVLRQRSARRIRGPRVLALVAGVQALAALLLNWDGDILEAGSVDHRASLASRDAEPASLVATRRHLLPEGPVRGAHKLAAFSPCRNALCLRERLQVGTCRRGRRWARLIEHMRHARSRLVIEGPVLGYAHNPLDDDLGRVGDTPLHVLGDGCLVSAARVVPFGTPASVISADKLGVGDNDAHLDQTTNV